MQARVTHVGSSNHTGVLMTHLYNQRGLPHDSYYFFRLGALGYNVIQVVLPVGPSGTTKRYIQNILRSYNISTLMTHLYNQRGLPHESYQFFRLEPSGYKIIQVVLPVGPSGTTKDTYKIFFEVTIFQHFVDPERKQFQKRSYDDGDEIDAIELALFSKRQDLLRQSNSKPGEIKQNNQYAMNLKP